MLNSRCKNHHPLCWLFKRSWIQAVVLSYLLLATLPSDAQKVDVCNLATAPQVRNQVLMKGASVIAGAYANASSQNLVGGPCAWTCGNTSVFTQFKKAFGFLQYNCTNNKSGMGLSITDAEYIDATNKIFRSGPTGVGDLMQVPSRLENASKSDNVKQLTDAVATIPGATWMKFSSTSVNNDKQGASRVLIRVPDPKRRFEQWIQIAIIDKTGKLGRNVDFLALLFPPGYDSSTNSPPPTVAFRGFSRTSTGFKLEGSRGLSKCYSCHPSGLRPIIPATQGTKAAPGRTPTIAIKPVGTMLIGPDLDSQLANIKEITSRRAVFGPAGYNAIENGPPLGPVSWFGRVRLVTRACAAGLRQDRQEAIINKMGCVNCHDSNDRGILNAGTSLVTIRHKVVQNLEAPMPPGVTDPDGLTPRERLVLFECLKAEYAEILQGWLLSDRLMVPGK